MGGRGGGYARKIRIGPIDPDAFTLNQYQFLNLLGIRATTDVPVDGRMRRGQVLSP